VIIVPPRSCRVPGCCRPLFSKRFCAGHEGRARKGQRVDEMPLGRPGERDLIAMIVKMYVELSLPSQVQVLQAMSAALRQDQLRAEAAD
jgi:hypothetical protein